MKRPLRRRSVGSLAASIAIHIVAVAALVQIVFRYPLGQLMGLTEPEVNQERVQYVKLPPQPTEHSGGGHAATPVQKAAPAPLETPAVAPTTVPDARPSDSSRAHAAGGTGTGIGVSGSGFATGVEPRQPDKRVALDPGPMVRVPRTVAEDVDSIVHVAIGIYQDSMALFARQRQPGDWTVKGKNGEKWGVDQKYIYVGKYKIPSALLALLPLNVSAQSPIERRSAEYIRRDVQYNAQRSITEDEFRAAVKRIRERKEREKREKMVASQPGDSTRKP